MYIQMTVEEAYNSIDIFKELLDSDENIYNEFFGDDKYIVRVTTKGLEIGYESDLEWNIK